MVQEPSYGRVFLRMAFFDLLLFFCIKHIRYLEGDGIVRDEVGHSFVLGENLELKNEFLNVYRRIKPSAAMRTMLEILGRLLLILLMPLKDE